MKWKLFIIPAAILISACSTTKEARTSRIEQREIRKLAEQVAVKNAIESRRYIIKVDRIYLTGGGFAELIPKTNFIIINGEAASVSLGYVGRSYSIRPVSGINFNGKTTRYDFKSDEVKGIYKINIEVKRGSDKFDLYLTVGSGGRSYISVNNSYIQNVSYSGMLVPGPGISRKKGYWL